MHASAWVAESVSSNIFCVGLCCLFTFHSIAPDPPSTTPPTATPIVVSHTFSITAAFFIWIIILWEKTLQRALAEHHSMNKQKASWRIRIYYMHTHTHTYVYPGAWGREKQSVMENFLVPLIWQGWREARQNGDDVDVDDDDDGNANDEQVAIFDVRHTACNTW